MLQNKLRAEVDYVNVGGFMSMTSSLMPTSSSNEKKHNTFEGYPTSLTPALEFSAAVASFRTWPSSQSINAEGPIRHPSNVLCLTTSELLTIH